MPRIDPPSSQIPPAPHAGDQRLVERMVCGDQNAWATFVHTHGRIIRARVADVARTFGRGVDESSIDDATAEVFAALIANDSAALRGFAARSSLSTYVAVIATRSATRCYAKTRFAAGTDSQKDLQHQVVDDSATDPIRDLIASETHDRLLGLLSRLPEKQREIIRLYHLESKSYAVIADSLGIPIGSVGVTLRRAETKLREQIEPD